MLGKIKSSYLLPEISSYLPEKDKLKLFKYNKAMQNLLNINIINYKLFKGLIKIEEPGMIIKNGIDIYQGESLNGKRNGKGKEFYYDGELKFEGEYLNGKRNGKGKEYYYCGELKFEGEYLNGKRNGKGKEYYYDGELKFEGEYLDGKNGMEKDMMKIKMLIMK